MSTMVARVRYLLMRRLMRGTDQLGRAWLSSAGSLHSRRRAVTAGAGEGGGYGIGGQTHSHVRPGTQGAEAGETAHGPAGMTRGPKPTPAVPTSRHDVPLLCGKGVGRWFAAGCRRSLLCPTGKASVPGGWGGQRRSWCVAGGGPQRPPSRARTLQQGAGQLCAYTTVWRCLWRSGWLGRLLGLNALQVQYPPWGGAGACAQGRAITTQN